MLVASKHGTWTRDGTKFFNCQATHWNLVHIWLLEPRKLHLRHIWSCRGSLSGSAARGGHSELSIQRTASCNCITVSCSSRVAEAEAACLGRAAYADAHEPQLTRQQWGIVPTTLMEAAEELVASSARSPVAVPASLPFYM